MWAIPMRGMVQRVDGQPVPFARVAFRRRRWGYVEGAAVPPITTTTEADAGGAVEVSLVPGRYIVSITDDRGTPQRAFMADLPGEWLQHAV